MKMEPETISYQIIADTGGNRYRFFCPLSGAVQCMTKPLRAETAEKELKLAWETEGRYFFNRCQKCGRWVSDVMYNASALECVDCTPWVKEIRFCPVCGKEINKKEKACSGCGEEISISENEENQKKTSMTMQYYGFGIEAMKQTRVCERCKTATISKEGYCIVCGKTLPIQNLFDRYRKRHPHCTKCGVVLAKETKFCIQCGKKQ